MSHSQKKAIIPEATIMQRGLGTVSSGARGSIAGIKNALKALVCT